MDTPDEPRKRQATLAWTDTSKTCPTCGGEFSAEVTFCPDDGARLEGGLPGGAAAEPEPEEDQLVGQMLMGKWRVLKRIGAGSFGTVYKVEDVKGGWIEALKILSVDRLTGLDAQNARIRFLREAQIMKRLGTQSPHIVGLSTYEEDLEAGLIYFVMEFVEGRSLAKVLEEEGPFSVERLVHVAVQACDALVVAHEGPEGVVHRDLKLENLMLTKDRTGADIVKVLDFGIAKIAEREQDSRLTTVGTLGTPGYAAPEQLRAENVDARTDLFAFGVILYSLLTGRDPWLGNPASQGTHQIYELMVASDRGDVRPMAEAAPGVPIPPAMESIVLKLLRRNREERFASARELKEALLRVGKGDVTAGMLRVLTDQPGVEVQIRSGMKTIAQGPTPCVADGLAAGTYKVSVRDPRFEPAESTVTVPAGGTKDITLVTTPRKTGVAGTVRRKGGVAAAAAVVAVLVGGAVLLRPWGTTLSLEDLLARAQAGEVADARLEPGGIRGGISRGALPALSYRVPLDEAGVPAAVAGLRSAGVDVDASLEVERLVGLAAGAQARSRYFGSVEDDVRTYAQRAAALDPQSPAARSLLRKVAERMAWDAEAAIADGAPETAQDLVRECLVLVPDHPRCTAFGGL